MAFSQALEEVIEAALADGVLTDKERAVLHKRAMAEGVDPDELDVVVEGRLAKMKRETDWLKPAPPASEKRGNIVKCPSCGASVPGGAAVCPECGHEFRNIQVNNTAKEFAKGLAEIEKRHSEKKTGMFDLRSDEKKMSEIASYVNNFPVPNSGDDLLEMLSFIQPNAKKSNVPYFNLYSSCINKARMNFSNDKRFAPYYAHFDKESKKMSLNTKIGIGFLIFVLIYIGGVYWGCSSNNEDKEAAEAQRKELVSKISALGIPTENNYDSLKIALIQINWSGDYKRDAYDSFMESKRAYAQTLNAFYKEHHNGEDDPALAEILTEKKETTEENVQESEMTDELKIDKQYNRLAEELQSMEEPNMDNYQSLKMKLKKLKWLPITSEAETAKKRFVSPSSEEKYERTKKEAFYELVRAQASILQSFYKNNLRNSEYDIDDDISHLENYGYE